MRTIALEAAFQIALKYCSKEVRWGKVSISVILVVRGWVGTAFKCALCRRLLLVIEEQTSP